VLLLDRIGVRHPTTCAGELNGYWTRNPDTLDALLKRMVTLAPLSHDEAEQASREDGIADIPWLTLLEHAISKLTRHGLGWIRSSRSSRDIALLWLRDQGGRRAAAMSTALPEIGESDTEETVEDQINRITAARKMLPNARLLRLHRDPEE
jgi:hypothetical protein